MGRAMGPDSGKRDRTVELQSPTERGWWLRTRRPDDAVSIVFRPEANSPSAPGDHRGPEHGPFRAMLVAHEGRMSVVQVFLDGVVGGHIVDLDTADGESRVILPTRAALDRALGTSVAGCFAVARVQLADEEG
jgi:hypothetical protein